MKNPVVTIKMKSNRLIKLELFPDKAPNTVNNFIYLVKKGFYNGLIFHRVIENFMIQGGDPEGQGIGGPGYSIKGEFTSNGIENDLNHIAGVISMARSQHMDSAGSQFFIMHKDAPHLDGLYAAFGKVIEGMDEIDRIAKTDTDFRDKPLNEERMISLVVDTFGIDYPKPQKISD